MEIIIILEMRCHSWQKLHFLRRAWKELQLPSAFNSSATLQLQNPLFLLCYQEAIKPQWTKSQFTASQGLWKKSSPRHWHLVYGNWKHRYAENCLRWLHVQPLMQHNTTYTGNRVSSYKTHAHWCRIYWEGWRILSSHTALFWQTKLLSILLYTWIFLLFPSSNTHVVFVCSLQHLSPTKARRAQKHPGFPENWGGISWGRNKGWWGSALQISHRVSLISF